MFVLGTAGHIDHGKSALIKALTGVDPDRLREEQERGMTIDLGFGWLKLPSGQEVGIVDVPGHERFVKNMLAGVGGIDLALLVIAANEGVMPQTREHLAILDLLEIKNGIVVLTKRDLVDEDWLSLVRMDVEEIIKPTTLANAPIIPVSAITKEGLPELVATIDKMLKTAEPKKDIGRPRLPVDRIFTIAGSGTVVTGTLIDGSFSIGQEVEIVPSGLKSRIRGLQTHKSKIDTASPGSRVAVNIVGIATTQVQRGDVLTRPGWLVPTTMVSVQLRLLSYLKRPLSHNTNISFHSGAAEAMGKVRLLEKDKLAPGESTRAQVVLGQPVALVKGDHYIIRSTMETLGGGRIIDAHAKRLRRFRSDVIESLKSMEKGSPEEIIAALLDAKQPLELAGILSQCQLPEKEARTALEALLKLTGVIEVGQGDHRLFLTANGWANLVKELTAVLQEYHNKFPAKPGMPKSELSSRMKLTKYPPAVWQKLGNEGVIKDEGTVVHLPSHQPKLNPAQQAKVDAFLASISKNPYSPPGDLIPEPDLLGLLIEQKKVVKVSDTIVFAASAYNEMVSKTVAYIKAHGKVTLGEVRDMFQTSRKYAQPFMEHLDEKKVTKRVGDERVLY